MMQSQMITPPQSRIKLNRRGFTELLLACAFLSLLTWAIWSWRVQGAHVSAMESAVSEPLSLLPQILRHPTIILSMIVTEFFLLLAVTLALVPVAWWLHTEHPMGEEGAIPSTPLRWLSGKIHRGRKQPQPAQGYYVMNAAGEPVYYEQPAVPGMKGMVVNQWGEMPPQQMGAPGIPGTMPQAGQSMPGQPIPGQPVPGQPVPGQPMPAQAMVPGMPIVMPPMAVTEVKPGQPAAAPGAPAPAAPPPVAPPPVSDVLNFEETPAEDDPLADLANIKDILSSAFDEDAGVDPEREALGRTLEDLEMHTVKSMARQIIATF
jgi:hypothetical protein